MRRSPRGWVVDSSVAGKWYLRDEELLEQADQIKDDYQSGTVPATAPSLSRHEVSNTLSTAVIMGRLDSQTANRHLAAFLNTGLSADEDPRWLVQNALRISVRLRVAVYDAAYLALAQSEDLSFVTADRRLYDAVRDTLPFVHWLGDL